MNLARRGVQLDGMGAQFNLVQVRQLEGGAEARGLLLHVVDQFRALDAFGPAGKILDQRGDGELAAGLVAFKDERVQASAAGVDGGRKSGAAGAENYCSRECRSWVLPVSILDGPGADTRLMLSG